MAMKMQLHGVVSVELGEIFSRKLDNGEEFSDRIMTIKTADYAGRISEYSVSMFADNGHSLLVDDAILADMKLPFDLKEAA